MGDERSLVRGRPEIPPKSFDSGDFRLSEAAPRCGCETAQVLVCGRRLFFVRASDGAFVPVWTWHRLAAIQPIYSPTRAPHDDYTPGIVS